MIATRPGQVGSGTMGAADTTLRPWLMADDSQSRAAPGSVGVYGLDTASLPWSGAADLLASLLRIAVISAGDCVEGALPDVSGVYQVVDGGIRFTPSFPFEPGLAYRATFDPPDPATADQGDADYAGTSSP